MAVLASEEVTISFMVDIVGTYRFYKLVEVPADSPARPSDTLYPPPDLLYDAGWDDAEPQYSEGSTCDLYYVDCTVYSNNTCHYSPVSLSTSYALAKQAYNKALQANSGVNDLKDSLEEEITTVTTDILETADYIALDVLSEYSKVSDLEEYKQIIENTLTVSKEGFDFSFKNLEEKLTAVGERVSTQESYIKFVDGEIIIGHAGENASPVTAVYTNQGMEIRYNNVIVAKYLNGIMEVENANIKNQIAYWGQWATRKGDEVTGKGHNLDFVWIGG